MQNSTLVAILTLCMFPTLHTLRISQFNADGKQKQQLKMPVRVLQLAMEKATAMGIQKFKGDSPVWTAEYTTAVVQYICNSWQFTQEGANTGFSMGISYPSNASIGVACGPAFLGDKKPYQLATPDSIFAMGSTTKMITAAAILKLVEDGKMSLNDKMLPRMEKAYKTLYAKFQDKKDAAGSPTHPDLVAWLGPEIKDITIGQMLMMESGIPDFDNMVSRTYQLKHPKVNLGPMENIDFIHFTKPDQPSQKKNGIARREIAVVTPAATTSSQALYSCRQQVFLIGSCMTNGLLSRNPFKTRCPTAHFQSNRFAVRYRIWSTDGPPR